MSDLTQIANNKNVLKAACRRLSLEQLNKLLEVTMQAIDEKEAEAAEREAQNAAKQQRLDEIRAQMDEAGITVDELEEPKRRGRPRKDQAN